MIAFVKTIHIIDTLLPKRYTSIIYVTSSKDSKDEEKEEKKEFYKLGKLVVLKDREFYVGDVGTSAGQGYAKPKDGNEFVVVSITIKNKMMH